MHVLCIYISHLRSSGESLKFAIKIVFIVTDSLDHFTFSVPLRLFAPSNRFQGELDGETTASAALSYLQSSDFLWLLVPQPLADLCVSSSGVACMNYGSCTTDRHL